MTLRVLEFNDNGLRVSNDTGVLHTSPGYALVLPQKIAFGDSARSQSRLNPLNSYNQYWHKLSVDSFAKPIGHFRHNADLAFSHLQHFAEQAQIEGDVLLALPGSFGRQQMAILLGLLKQSPLNPIGIVDAGLVATVDRHEAETILHADLELHQVVLSKLRKIGNTWQREAVLLVPSVGWENISENLMQLFTSAFIQQCRFNPQHNASSEQMLFDSLPEYLQEEQTEQVSDEIEESKRSLKIKLRHNDTLHEINLPRSHLYSRLNGFYQKILQQIESLDSDGRSPLFISDRLGQLPQVVEVLAQSQGQRREVTLLPADAVAMACLRYSDVVASNAEGVRFVSQLASKHTASVTPMPPKQRLRATHLLCANTALPLREGILISQEDANGELGFSIIKGKSLPMPSAATKLATIELQEGEYVVQASDPLKINGIAVAGSAQMNLGDNLQFANLSQTLQLIAVQEHDA